MTAAEQLPRPKFAQGAPLTSNRQMSGRARARYWYAAPEACQQCGKVGAVERHHIDANPLNNSQENISFLCRRCHMETDGRIGGRLRRDSCRNGHPRSEENTYVSPRGQRTCLICKRNRRSR